MKGVMPWQWHIVWNLTIPGKTGDWSAAVEVRTNKVKTITEQ